MVPKDSLCVTCAYGHCINGQIVHRTAKFGESNDNDLLDDIEDYLDEDEQDAYDPPKINLKELYINTTTSICYFPHLPGTNLPGGFESYTFTDGVIEKCNRYKKMDV